MRLLFIGKRFPQQRDLVQRPYGRFYHLPLALAKMGHCVRLQYLSHRRLPSMRGERNGVLWSSHDVRTLGVRGLWRTLTTEVDDFAPDWVIGFSDAWFGWLAHRLSRRTGALLLVDAYDNYEAYIPWNMPLHWAWRRAVRAADLVTAAGPQLSARLQRHRSLGRHVELIPMAADPVFVPMDRVTCRGLLGLPESSPLIGYAGSWAGNRGTRIIADAFQRVRAVRPDARLVLTGYPPKSVRALQGVLLLGYIEDAQLPVFLNTLNAACVVTADTQFGRYSYPAKLCEAMACRIPVVATATEPVRWMLKDDRRFLVPVGDTEGLANRILNNLSIGRVDYGELPSWEANGKRLEELLSE